MQKSTRRFFSRRIALCLYVYPFLLCGGSQVLAAQSYKSLQQRVAVRLDKTTAYHVVRLLQQQTSFAYVYDPQYLESCRIARINFPDAPLGAVLGYMDRHAPLDIDYENNTVAIRKGAAEAAVKQDKKGAVTGRVVDSRNEPLPGVTVMVEGGSGVTTRVDGTYELQLAPGRYTLVFRYISFTTRKVTDVDVKAGQPTTLHVVMTPSPASLKEVVITASYQRASAEGLYALQKNNAAVSDGISAEQIRATPDNNAAQVLKRVNGLTVQDDKFVTVRGLSERYNNVILNGANLPGTEPNRRNFSFDVIPSALIDNIIVNKTATPDMPAEFAGGLVQVNTRSIPDRDFLSLTAGTGINTNSSGKNMYSTPRGDKDILGFDDGTRRWWNRTWNADVFRQLVVGGDAAKRSEMERRIPNNWGLYRYPYAPVQHYQLSAGKKVRLNGGRSSLGLTLAGTFRHEEAVRNEERFFPSYYHYDSVRTYSFNTALGGVANLGFETRGHRLAFKNLYNRRFSNETNVNHGWDWSFSGDAPVKHYINTTLINTLWQNRLEGEHLLGQRLKFDWSADHISLERDQPDTRSSRGRSRDGVKGQYRDYLLNDGNGYMVEGLNIFNALLTEKRKNLAANFTIPFTVNGASQSVKAGYAGIFRDVDYRSQNFRTFYSKEAMQQTGRADSAVFGKADYELHTATFFQPGLLEYLPTGTGSFGFRGDDYAGKQQIHAGYLMADLKFLRNFRFIGGLRVEQSNMEVTGVSYNVTTGKPVDSLLKWNKADWLPSANLIYSLNDRMNIRAAYSKTLARAEFRERAPYIYYEFKERAEYYGAKGLKDAEISNYDLRYEYYPAPGEVLSLSVFYKAFKNPVEIVGAWSGGVDPRFFYFNLRNSTNIGVELDIRKSLKFLQPASSWLKRVIVSANGSLMKAEVRYNTDQLLAAAGGITGSPDLELAAADSRKRPLQGLSPYVINGGIGYFGELFGVNVVYNRYGPRIVNAGYQEWEDLYENPRDVIDLQVSVYPLKRRMQVRLNISDLLQQETILYMNQSLYREPGYVSPVGNHYSLTGKTSDDPKGNRYNSRLDYARHRWFKGRNLGLNVTYTF